VAKKDNSFRAKTGTLKHVPLTSATQGITRVRRGKGFSYHYRGKPVRSASLLNRIRALAIPPAWAHVWICPSANGHLQATGVDAAGRKQYRYHPLWVNKRSQKKYDRLLQFGYGLPALRRQVSHDLRDKEWNERKVIAIAIRLLECSHIRPGNPEYEKRYHSFGLSTLRDDHVKIGNGKMTLTFRGKKGIMQQQSIRDKHLIRLIRSCRELPGKKLFQYYTPAGNRRSITSTLVNQYIQEACGENFSAKDFRTWAGSIYALDFLLSKSATPSNDSPAQDLKSMLLHVSSRLGNTASICHGYYIHPVILEYYKEKNCLTLIRPARAGVLFGKNSLSSLEKTFLRLLKKKRKTD